jgi:hypothetical protein
VTRRLIGVELCVELAEVDRLLPSYIEVLRDDLSYSFVMDVHVIGPLTFSVCVAVLHGIAILKEVSKID